MTVKLLLLYVILMLNLEGAISYPAEKQHNPRANISDDSNFASALVWPKNSIKARESNPPNDSPPPKSDGQFAQKHPKHPAFNPYEQSTSQSAIDRDRQNSAKSSCSNSDCFDKLLDVSESSKAFISPGVEIYYSRDEQIGATQFHVSGGLTIKGSTVEGFRQMRWPDGTDFFDEHMKEHFSQYLSQIFPEAWQQQMVTVRDPNTKLDAFVDVNWITGELIFEGSTARQATGPLIGTEWTVPVIIPPEELADYIIYIVKYFLSQDIAVKCRQLKDAKVSSYWSTKGKAAKPDNPDPVSLSVVVQSAVMKHVQEVEKELIDLKKMDLYKRNFLGGSNIPEGRNFRGVERPRSIVSLAVKNEKRKRVPRREQSKLCGRVNSPLDIRKLLKRPPAFKDLKESDCK